MPDVIPVRQAGSLPPASFRFQLAVDTLALGYVLGTINPHSGLAPVRLHPCPGAHRELPGDVPGSQNIDPLVFNLGQPQLAALAVDMLHDHRGRFQRIALHGKGGSDNIVGPCG